MRILKRLAVLAATLIPNIANAQNVNDFPLSFGAAAPEIDSPSALFRLGTPVSEKKEKRFSSLLDHPALKELPYSLGEDMVTITAREPIFERIYPSPESIWHSFTACSKDGGKFDFELSIYAEKSAVEYQTVALGEDTYNEKVSTLYESMSEAFKVVAKETHGRDLHRIFGLQNTSEEEILTYFQNLAAVQRHISANKNNGGHEFLSRPNFRIRAITSPGNQYCRDRMNLDI